MEEGSRQARAAFGDRMKYSLQLRILCLNPGHLLHTKKIYCRK